MKKYASIRVYPETKERFLEFGTAGDSQESLLNKMIDFYEKYHGKIEEIEKENEWMTKELNSGFGR